MRRFAALVVALGIVAGGCGSNGSSAGGPAKASGAPVSSREVLDFSLPAVGGGKIAGADYSRQALALWFWAPW